MTHIIRSPKPRKRGATFADVKPLTYFLLDGESHHVRLARPDTYGNNALNLRENRYVTVADDHHVRLLTQPQPIAPEPDPDVCTYGELKPGDTFVVTDYGGDDTLQLKTESTHVDFNGELTGEDPPEMKVRRVSASVVEHEEPGTHASSEMRDGERVFYVGDGIDGVTLELEDAKVTLRQLAAILAQQAVSPESGEPEPAEGRCEVDSRCTRPAGHGGSCWSDTWHEKQDRSKPAPGWTVEEYGGDGHAPVWAAHGPGETAYRRFETSAVAWTWAQHDAQQAGKGGES